MMSVVSHWTRNWIKVSVPSFAFFGCTLGWALELGYVTPTFEILGVSDTVVNYLWIASPLSGLITQPIVGMISDSIIIESHEQVHYKWYQFWKGKRRPFIFFGALASIISMLVFSNATWIATNVFGNNDNSLILALSIIAFWIMDISFNVIQAPLRALLSDIIENEWHAEANGMFGIMQGFGAMAGYLIGYALGYESNSGISLLYAVGASFMGIMAFLTLVLSNNEQVIPIDSLSISEIRRKRLHLQSTGVYSSQATSDLPPNELTSLVGNSRSRFGASAGGSDEPPTGTSRTTSNQPNSRMLGWSEFYQEIMTMPLAIKRAFVVNICAYWVLLAIGIYFTSWFGTVITGGTTSNGGSSSYRKGVKLGNLGLTFMAALSILVSIVLPRMLNARMVTYRQGFMFALLTSSILLCLLPFTNYYTGNDENASIIVAIVLVSLLGIWYGAQAVIPWAIVTKTLVTDSVGIVSQRNDGRTNEGLYTTFFNISQCVPQIIQSLISGEIIDLFDGEIGSVMILGGIVSFIGFIVAYWIIEPDSDESNPTDETNDIV